jgi:hypothetical protein
VASARLRDVLDAAGGAPSISRKPESLVRGMRADANNAGGEGEPVFYDLDRLCAFFSQEKAPCQNCSSLCLLECLSYVCLAEGIASESVWMSACLLCVCLPERIASVCVFC